MTAPESPGSGTSAETVWCDAHPGEHPLADDCKYPHYTTAGYVAATARFKADTERIADRELPAVEPATWHVNALPREHPRWRDTRVRVAHIVPQYADPYYLVRTLHHVLNQDGGWDLETRNSDADDDWEAAHAWTDQAEAFAAARRAAVDLARQLTQ